MVDFNPRFTGSRNLINLQPRDRILVNRLLKGCEVRIFRSRSHFLFYGAEPGSLVEQIIIAVSPDQKPHQRRIQFGISHKSARTEMFTLGDTSELVSVEVNSFIPRPKFCRAYTRPSGIFRQALPRPLAIPGRSLCPGQEGNASPNRLLLHPVRLLLLPYLLRLTV